MKNLILIFSIIYGLSVFGQNQGTEDTFFDDGQEFEDIFTSDDEVDDIEELDSEVAQEDDDDEYVEESVNDGFVPQKDALDDVPVVNNAPPPLPKSKKGISVERIPHPNAKKGLIRITRDRTYLYKVKTTPQTKATTVSFGFFQLDELQSKEGGASFDDFYDEGSMPLVMYEHEWQMYDKFGKLGFKVGGGIHISNGKGVFANNTEANKGLEPEEGFSFYHIPLNAVLVYRADYWHNQFLVPYAEGGLGIIGFGELRDDGKPFKVGDEGWRLGGAAVGIVGAGLALDLGTFSRDSILNLDREYGINDVFLAGGYRYQIGFTTFDFTSGIFHLGLLVEF